MSDTPAQEGTDWLKLAQAAYTESTSYFDAGVRTDIERDLRPLARRYLGKEMGDRYVEETRNLPTHTDNVLIHMRPERWLTADYSKEDDAG